MNERFVTPNIRFSSEDELKIQKEITDIESESLIKKVSDKEIKETKFDMPQDKSPSMDGFPVDVFKQYWNTVWPSVCNAMKAFSHSAYMLKEIHHSFVALIPKTDNLMNINHYTTISLHNNIYKIITKILSNRLKPLLDKIINSC